MIADPIMFNQTKYFLLRSRVMVSAILLLICSGAAFSEVKSKDSELVVVATIKPLHSLAAVVAEGVFEPRLLMSGSVSPHTFQLKPSHIKAVKDADIVLWAGDGVERFIPSLISKFAPQALSVEFAALPGVVTHRSRFSHKDADFTHDHTDDHSKDGPADTGHSRHSSIDAHLWLEPRNAALLVGALAQQFALRDPANAEQYSVNAERFQLVLKEAIAEIEQALKAVKGQPYLVYHDSLQYFEKGFGLGAAIVVSSQPQMQAGAKRLKALRVEVATAKPVCIFSEPQFRAPALKALATDLHLKTESIDPLASNFIQGSSLYVDWLVQTAKSIASCMSPDAQ